MVVTVLIFFFQNAFGHNKSVEIALIFDFIIHYLYIYIFFSYDPSLTYGRKKRYPFPVFKPHFVEYDKKCLTFFGYFKQSVFESPQEHLRIRKVNVLYFLEDDTVTVMEPPIEVRIVLQNIYSNVKYCCYLQQSSLYFVSDELHISIVNNP